MLDDSYLASDWTSLRIPYLQHPSPRIAATSRSITYRSHLTLSRVGAWVAWYLSEAAPAPCGHRALLVPFGSPRYGAHLVACADLGLLPQAAQYLEAEAGHVRR